MYICHFTTKIWVFGRLGEKYDDLLRKNENIREKRTFLLYLGKKIWFLKKKGNIPSTYTSVTIYIFIELRSLFFRSGTQKSLIEKLPSCNVKPRDEDSDPDPLIFGLPDPTCNNGYIKLFSSWTKYKPESTNSSYDNWLTKYFHLGKFLNKSETSYWGTAVTII